MFEDKEEVKKAMMDLKLFGLGDFESPDEDILESTFEGAENQIQVSEETILSISSAKIAISIDFILTIQKLSPKKCLDFS